MADNVTANSGSGGAVFATDDIGSVHYPRSKVVWGPDGTANDADTASGKALPVQLRTPLGDSVVDDTADAVKVVQQASTNTIEVVGDAAHDAAASGNPVLIGAEFDDTTPDSVDEGDVGRLRISANRNLYSTIRDAAGNERGVNVTAGNAMTVDGSSVTQPISAASLPLPTGASTSANQSTANTALSAIQTAVETLDNAISGSEMQVDVVGSLPAGTNAIGKLAANSGVDIGDVDVTSVTPGTTASALGKAEDAAHSSGDVGVFMLGVRRDSATSGADTDGDYAALGLDSSGRLHCNVGNSVTVTGTVTAAQATAANLNCTEASAASIKTAVELIDDIVESGRAKSNPIVGQAGVAAGAGAVGATTQRMTLASDDPAVVALQIMDDWDNAASDGASVSGDVAHDSADAGEPVKIGAKAVSTEPTAVTANDRTNLIADLAGKQVVSPYCLSDDILDGTNNATGTSNTEVIAAQGAGVRIYVTTLIIWNSSGTDTHVDIKSGTTTKLKLPAPATADTGGGSVVTFPVPLRLAANEALNFASGAGVTTMYVSAVGFKGR